MTKTKKLIIRALTGLMIIAALALIPMTCHENVQAASGRLSKKSATLKPGKTLKLKLRLKIDAGSKVKWSSSNKKVATVSSSGKVKAKKAGKATITAKYKGKGYKCKITVKNPADIRISSCVLWLRNMLVKNSAKNIYASVDSVDGDKVTIHV